MNTTPSVSGTQSIHASSSREDTQYVQKFQSKEQASAKQISGSEGASPGVKGKHIAQRSVSRWVNYGNPDDWDREFETAVLSAVESIKKGDLHIKNIVEHFQRVRFQIAFKRKNKSAEKFGARRDYRKKGSSIVHYTKNHFKNSFYGYASERALKIPYDGKYFLELQGDVGKLWLNKAYQDQAASVDFLRYGLVQGYIDEKPIPLTQYIFCQKQEPICTKSESWFGESSKSYIGENNESSLWVHTAREQIPFVLEYIKNLIDKALNGNLTVIPRIHWWYVHLAPSRRGSGGTVEMITNTLCRLHGVDLPPWKEGVAPSVEVLLEPNEEKFCANYHELFAFDQEDLKELFKKPD